MTKLKEYLLIEEFQDELTEEEINEIELEIIISEEIDEEYSSYYRGGSLGISKDNIIKTNNGKIRLDLPRGEVGSIKNDLDNKHLATLRRMSANILFNHQNKIGDIIKLFRARIKNVAKLDILDFVIKNGKAGLKVHIYPSTIPYDQSQLMNVINAALQKCGLKGAFVS